MKKQFLEAYESGRQEEAVQQKLHARHNIEDENVIVLRLIFELLSIYSTKENLIEIPVELCYYFFGITKMVGG